MWLPAPMPQVISWSGGVKGRAVKTGTRDEVAGAVSVTHWAAGLRAPVFLAVKEKGLAVKAVGAALGFDVGAAA